jgi:hypothetical protein
MKSKVTDEATGAEEEIGVVFIQMRESVKREAIHRHIDGAV